MAGDEGRPQGGGDHRRCGVLVEPDEAGSLAATVLTEQDQREQIPLHAWQGGERFEP